MDHPERVDAYIAWKDWDAASFARCSALDGIYYEAETAISARAGACVLELGFGNGAFLAWADARGASVHGIELIPELVARARSRFANGCFASSLDEPAMRARAGTFTHVVAFDVIEHVELARLPSLFAQIYAALAPGGRAVLRFPNGDSPFGRMVQHGDPTHVTTLGRQRLEWLARGAGFEIAQIRAPALPLRGGGLVRMFKRALLRTGRGMVERVIGWLYFGGQRIPLDSNYVAVLIKP